MAIWMHDVFLDDVSVDPCKVVLPLRITHGRSGGAAQPDAPQCEFTWLGATFPKQIGARLDVRVRLVSSDVPQWIYDAPDNYTYDSPLYMWDNVPWYDVGPRFSGTVTGLTANEAGGNVESWTVTGIGGQVKWGMAHVTQLQAPVQTDVQRVQSIVAATGAITIHGTSTLMMAAEELNGNVLSLLHEVCQSSGGLVWQARDGTMHYGTANHRRVAPVGVLDCDTIRDGITWTNQVEQIVNHVTVKFGTADAEITVDDAASVDAWGERHVDVTTRLATQDDAAGLAAVIIGRRAWPYWLMPGVLTYPDKAARYDQETLAGIDVGSMLLLPADEQPSPTPGPLTQWIVEGWVEEREPARTTIQLALADAARWAQTYVRTWDDARQVTWADEKTSTWLDALSVEVIG